MLFRSEPRDEPVGLGLCITSATTPSPLWPPCSDGPHYLAMQLASIADEMELRLLLPQFVEPIRMTVYR